MAKKFQPLFLAIFVPAVAGGIIFGCDAAISANSGIDYFLVKLEVLYMLLINKYNFLTLTNGVEVKL